MPGEEFIDRIGSAQHDGKREKIAQQYRDEINNLQTNINTFRKENEELKANFEKAVAEAKENAEALIQDFPITFEPQSAVEKLLKCFDEARTARRHQDIAVLFAEEGVVLLNNQETALGRVAIEIAFEKAFKEFKPEEESFGWLRLDDVVEVGELAYAHGVSKGKRAGVACLSRDLFVLKKIDNNWLFGSYINNSPQN